MIVQAGTVISRLGRIALGESASAFWLSAAPTPAADHKTHQWPPLSQREPCPDRRQSRCAEISYRGATIGVARGGGNIEAAHDPATGASGSCRSISGRKPFKRRSAGETLTSIAKSYGVAVSMISRL